MPVCKAILRARSPNLAGDLLGMIDLDLFQNVQLHGGFTIVRLEITSEPLMMRLDAMRSHGRELWVGL